jgi:TonB family protein
MILLAALALAAEPPPAPPRDGGWGVDWGDQLCTLMRATPEENSATLRLEMVPGSAMIRLIVLKDGWDDFSAPRSGSVRLHLHPSGEEVEALVSTYRDKTGRGLDFTLVDEGVLDRLATSTSLTVDGKQRSLLQIPLPSAGKAVKALRDCEADGLRAFGIDPSAWARLQRRPKSLRRLYRWFDDSDYPPALISAGVSGRVTVRLRIDTSGTVAGCAPVVSSGSRELDVWTCALLMKRARFEPALGPDGRPAEGFSIARVSWLLPD